jgi:hypothetical protein
MKYAVIPGELMRAKCPSSTKTVYGTINTYASISEDGFAYLSIPTIADGAGIGERTVDRALRWLKSHCPAGSEVPWLKVKTRRYSDGKLHNFYFLAHWGTPAKMALEHKGTTVRGAKVLGAKAPRKNHAN